MSYLPARTNGDDRLRGLERRAAQGDPQAQQALIMAQIRAGVVTPPSHQLAVHERMLCPGCNEVITYDMDDGVTNCGPIVDNGFCDWAAYAMGLISPSEWIGGAEDRPPTHEQQRRILAAHAEAAARAERARPPFCVECSETSVGLDPFSGSPLCDFHLAQSQREWAARGRRDLWFGRVRAGDRMKPPRLNPGDDRLRDLERRAAQGDPAAQAQLDRMRERLRPRGLAEMPTIQRRRPSVVNEALVANLVLLADNERDLHEAQQRVVAGLIEKYLNGKYDPVKAERAWQSIADEAGRRYARAAAEYNEVRYGGGYGSATKPARYAAAQDLAQRFEEQARWGDERWEVLATQIAAGMLAKPKRRKKNPGDDRLRALERAARLGDPNALRGALHEAVRLRQSGVVYERLLGLAMDFGDQALIDEAASAYWHARGAFDKNACVDCGGEATRTSYLSQPNKHYCEGCWNRACYGDTRSNPPRGASRGDDNLRSLERAYLAGDAAAAHAYNAELFRRGMHNLLVPPQAHHNGLPRGGDAGPASVAFYPYAPAGWYVISKNGTWSRASWRTAEDALAAAADMIALDNSGHAYFERNSDDHNARRRDLERRSNPGDEDRRRAYRDAERGDDVGALRAAAIEALRVGDEARANDYNNRLYFLAHYYSTSGDGHPVTVSEREAQRMGARRFAAWRRKYDREATHARARHDAALRAHEEVNAMWGGAPRASNPAPRASNPPPSRSWAWGRCLPAC